MTAPTPDPVKQGADYQRLLLSLLGDDDPAQVQARTPTAARELVEDAAADLRRRPEAKEWSALELVGHLHDAEIVMSARYRWVLSQERPPIPGYDQDLWVDRLHHNAGDPKELLGVFAALRAANLRLWQRTPRQDRARVGLHAERGPESYDLMFRMIAGHDRFHLNQAGEALARLRKSGATA